MGGKSAVMPRSSVGGAGSVGSSSSSSSSPSVWWSLMLLTIWFSSSVCSTLVNKGLMDKFPYAVTLAAVHMASAAVVDFAFVCYRGLGHKFRKDVLIACIPVALTINFGKTMTYVSYGLVPASLTHTAKASSPVFSVIVSKVLFNQVPSLATFLSLIPITVGVTLSALTELNWVFLGFLAAVGAALANVLNSTYTKKALHSPSMAVDPLIFHMYTAVAAVCMLLPWAMVVEMPNMTLFASSATPHTHLGELGEDGLPLPSLPLLHVFPFRSMLLSLALHYAQNLSNIYYLHGVSVLTHQVTQSLKRLLNIAGAVLYFGNRVTLLNAAGMGLALIGFSMYSYAKQAPPKSKGLRSASNATSPPVSPPNITTNGNGRSGRTSPYVKSPVTLMVEGLSSSDSMHEGLHLHTLRASDSQIALDAYAASVPTAPYSLQQPWAPMPRSDSTESMHSSPDNGVVYTQYALHPTAHAQALAAAATAQQQQQQQQPLLRPGFISPVHKSNDRSAIDDNFLV